MVAPCYWGMQLQIAKRLTMVVSRWSWVVSGGAVVNWKVKSETMWLKVRWRAKCYVLQYRNGSGRTRREDLRDGGRWLCSRYVRAMLAALEWWLQGGHGLRVVAPCQWGTQVQNGGG